jgi:uncharacterized protein
MTDEKESSVLVQVVKDGYKNFFNNQWSVMTAGILIAVISIALFAWARPWGVVGGLRNWADWLFYLVGAYNKKPINPLISTNSILTLGLLWGAFISALMAKQFAFNRIPKLEMIKAVVGGLFLGVGSAMAGGCNLGGFYMALSSLSLTGLLMFAGLLAGANLGIRYLFWEMENIPTGGTGGGGSKEGGFNWKSIQPYLGVAMFILALVSVYIYNSMALTVVGGLLMGTLAIGFIFQRSRICFVAGFRDPFMTGETDKTKAIIVSIIITILGFAALKWTGLRPEGAYVTSTFWFGSLVGGLIFGFGMVISGGCGSGCVFRAGEGNIKLIIVLVFFATSNSLFKQLINSSAGFKSLIGSRFFMPDVLSYSWTIVIAIAAMLAWYLFVTWNEETEKFVIEL